MRQVEGGEARPFRAIARDRPRTLPPPSSPALEVARPLHGIVEFMDSRSGLPKTREHFGRAKRPGPGSRARLGPPLRAGAMAQFTFPNRMETGGQMDGVGS